MEDLREAKQFEYLCKTMQIMNNSLEAENQRLIERLAVKGEVEARGEGGSKEAKIEAQALSAQITDLQDQLQNSKAQERKQATAVS